MRAVVLREYGGPLRLEERPVPRPGPGEVLVRVRACGVCRTDLKIRAGLKGDVRLPLVPGHEPAGEVAEVGEGVSGLRAGDHVVVMVYFNCGACPSCRAGAEGLCDDLRGKLGSDWDGGYAEYFKAPAANLFPIAPHVPWEQAAVLSCAVGTAYHALKSRARLAPGESVVVVGAGGGVGVHGVQVAKLLGARAIAVDLGGGRLGLAREAGADELVDASSGSFSERVRELTGGRGADVVAEFVALPATIPESLASLRKGGRLLFVGYDEGADLRVNPSALIARELTVLGSRNTSKGDLRELIGHVERGAIRPVVRAVFPLEEAEEAHRRLASGRVLGRAALRP